MQIMECMDCGHMGEFTECPMCGSRNLSADERYDLEEYEYDDEYYDTGG